MKTYLNREEREYIVTALAFWDFLLKLETVPFMTPKEHGRIKSARTHILHTTDSIIERLDVDFAKRILKDAENMHIFVIDKNHPSQLKKMLAGADDVVVSQTAIYDLASFALKECVGCQKTEHKQCDRYQLFVKLNIPPAVLSTNGCPYYN